MRHQISGHVQDDSVQLKQRDEQVSLLWRLDLDLIELGVIVERSAVYLSLSGDRADTRVGVQHVASGVALE